ncbi:MAG: hypothetical protein HQL13_05370 [Candidatus Omnitrophica bacterium]|nr:hypothetical protein [Candidatus Omnitrophota bacterium]
MIGIEGKMENMMSQYWFKPKKYGWGVFPVSWQGALALLILVLLILTSAYLNGLFENSQITKAYLRFGLDVIIMSSLFCLMVSDKTEGGVKWRWGNEKD